MPSPHAICRQRKRKKEIKKTPSDVFGWGAGQDERFLWALVTVFNFSFNFELFSMVKVIDLRSKLRDTSHQEYFRPIRVKFKGFSGIGCPSEASLTFSGWRGVSVCETS